MRFLRYFIFAFLAAFALILLAFLDFTKNVLSNVFSEKLKDDTKNWILLHQFESIAIFVAISLLSGFIIYIISWLWNKRTTAKTVVQPGNTKALFLNLVRNHLNSSLETRLRDVGMRFSLEAQSGKIISSKTSVSLTQKATEELRQGIFQPSIKLLESDRTELLNEDFLTLQGKEDAIRLLILGNPGAGKSVVLTQLALAMVKSLQNKQGDPLTLDKAIPVILNLSGWGGQKQTLEEWIPDEVARTYGLGFQVAKTAFEKSELAILFDGLDELNRTDQIKCVHEINMLVVGGKNQNLNINIVVSTRTREYADLLDNTKAKLDLNSTWQLKPLSDTQIAKYLKKAGQNAQGLRNALKAKTLASIALQDLVRVPLYLQVATVALQGLNMSQMQPSELKEAIWEQYVTHVFSRVTDERKQINPKTETTRLKPFSRGHSIRYLCFLAALMKRHGLSELHLEHLQPMFLPHSILIQFRWIIGLEFGLAFGFNISLGMILITDGFLLWVGILISAVAGLIFGGLARYFPQPVITGAFVGIAFALSRSLWGVILGVVSAISFANLLNQYSKLQPEEILIKSVSKFTWSWRLFWFNVIGHVIYAVLVSLFIFFVTRSRLLVVAFLVGVILHLVQSLAKSWQAETIPESHLIQPNEGILRTLKYMLTNGVLGALSGILFAGIGYYLKTQQQELGWFRSFFSLKSVPILFFLAASYRGLDQILRHLGIRLTLWQANLTPYNYVDFLNKASDLLLLSRRGGGYAFIHQELRDYFAHLAETDSNILPANLLPPEQQP